MWASENQFDPDVAAASAEWSVPVALIKAHIGIESAFNPAAMNYTDPGFAWGLMQMIPATARGLRPPYTGPMQALVDQPRLAIRLGAQLIAENLRRSGGVVSDSVSAYNGGYRPTYGFGSKRPDGVYGNQAYVDRVMAAYRYFGGSEVAPSTGGSFSVNPGVGGAGRVAQPSWPSWWARFLTWLGVR